jgi:DNA polymerase-3 subunit gamma/tau
MTLVLYRKYRPQTFAEIVGQEETIKILSNATATNNLSHAYLFSGPRGTGKTTTGRILAKAINCLQRKKGESEPCNRCSSCVDIMQARAVDLIEIDAASHRGIDEIKQLREETRFNPMKSKYKIYILDEAHQLTVHAFNALLKILEEPSSHIIFILITTEGHKILPTIASRCQKLNFNKLNLNQIVSRLKILARLEKIKIEEQVLKLIAVNSEGAIRDAENLLQKMIIFSSSNKTKTITLKAIREFLGIPEIEIVNRFVSDLVGQKTAQAIALINEIYEKGTDVQKFLRLLISYLREILILKINPKIDTFLLASLTEDEQKEMKAQVNKLEEVKLHQMLHLFSETAEKIKSSSIPQLPLELAIVELTMNK